ncbi:MAG TPA: hypothetical protein V6C81_21330 [Planktothrix sp.]|jgi:hypothetical protein
MKDEITSARLDALLTTLEELDDNSVSEPVLPLTGKSYELMRYLMRRTRMNSKILAILVAYRSGRDPAVELNDAERYLERLKEAHQRTADRVPEKRGAKRICVR